MPALFLFVFISLSVFWIFVLFMLNPDCSAHSAKPYGNTGIFKVEGVNRQWGRSAQGWQEAGSREGVEGSKGSRGDTRGMEWFQGRTGVVEVSREGAGWGRGRFPFLVVWRYGG